MRKATPPSYILAVSQCGTHASAFSPEMALDELALKLLAWQHSASVYRVSWDADIDTEGGELILGSGEAEKLEGVWKWNQEQGRNCFYQRGTTPVAIATK